MMMIAKALTPKIVTKALLFLFLFSFFFFLFESPLRHKEGRALRMSLTVNRLQKSYSQTWTFMGDAPGDRIIYNWSSRNCHKILFLNYLFPTKTWTFYNFKKKKKKNMDILQGLLGEQFDFENTFIYSHLKHRHYSS